MGGFEITNWPFPIAFHGILLCFLLCSSTALPLLPKLRTINLPSGAEGRGDGLSISHVHILVQSDRIL